MFYTVQQVKKNIFDTSCLILNLPTTTQKVRFAYSDKSASFIEKGEDIVYIDINLMDDAITKYTDLLMEYNGNPEKNINMINFIINKWNIKWTAYGENAYSNIFKFRTKILEYLIKQKLKQVKLVPIPHFLSPTRVSEEFQGKWINRWDFQVNMYQKLDTTETIPSILELGDLNIIPNK